jgi:hypothetical protein
VREGRAGAAVPIDFLVTIPDVPRSVVSLQPRADGSLAILSDGKPIGSMRMQGVLVTPAPEGFGPGYARPRHHPRPRQGRQPAGAAEIIAALDGGIRYKVNLIVE